jgi:hypothetical protein
VSLSFFQTCVSTGSDALASVITELIVGYMLPGRPVAMMIFKTFGYISEFGVVRGVRRVLMNGIAMTQALAFVSDLSESRICHALL